MLVFFFEATLFHFAIASFKFSKKFMIVSFPRPTGRPIFFLTIVYRKVL